MTKNNRDAIKYLLSGNYFYEKDRCCEALLAFNRSLCFAELGTQIASICYGKRSLVYFHLKEYKLCLANIELTEQQKPTAGIGQLANLRTECIRLMQTHSVEPDEDPMNFFKLSYPANEKLPCLSEGLQLRKNKKYGRHIVSTRDLKIGDIIAVTDFSFIFFDKRARLHHCNHCTKCSKLNLIPCLGCAKAMYCSEECMAMDKKKFHQFECGIDDNPVDQHLDFNPLKMFMHILAQFDGNVDEMKTFLTTNKQAKCVFDFDLSNKNDPMYYKNLILATLSMSHNMNCSQLGKSHCLQTHHRFIMHHPKLRALWMSSHKTFLDNLLLTFLDIEDAKGRINCFSEIDINLKESGYEIIDQKTDTPAMIGPFYPNIVAHVNDPYMCLLNQSCYPNVITKFVDGCHAWIVVRPVKTGDQLFIFLGPGARYVTPRAERQKLMRECFGFQCDCDGCLANWPPQHEMRRYIDLSTEEERLMMLFQNVHLKAQIREAKSKLYAEYIEYAGKIQAMSKYYPCLDIVYLESKWMFNIYRLALPAKWFCRSYSPK